MVPEQSPSEQPTSKFENLHKVTPLSRYLAMALFVILPFLGGWVGYTFAPEKVVEVDPTNTIQKSEGRENVTNESAETQNIPSLVSSKEYIGLTKENRKVSVEMPYQVVLTPDKQLHVVDVRKETSKDKVLLNSPLPVLVSETLEKDNKLYFSTAMHVSQHNTNKTGMAGTISLISNIHSYHLTENYIETYNYDYESYFWPIDNEADRESVVYRRFYDDINRPIVPFIMTNCIACYPDVTFGLLNSETYELHKIGHPARFEWVDEDTYRYKDYPSDDEPQAEFVHTDRDSGVPCGIGGCPMSNIDWELVPWREGSI